MLRFIAKCLIAGTIIYAVVVYAAFLHSGRLWLPGFTLPSLSWVFGKPEMKPLEAPEQPTWRWLQNGRWHYGDKPPAGIKAERIDRAAKEAEKLKQARRAKG